MQEILFNETTPLPFAPPVEHRQRERAARKDSKKNRILELHRAGTSDIGDQNTYSRFFRNVLSFKTVEAARESVERIAQLYKYFERIGDRAGQHHAEVLALTGRNRARFSGKKEESRVFEEWLFNH